MPLFLPSLKIPFFWTHFRHLLPQLFCSLQQKLFQKLPLLPFSNLSLPIFSLKPARVRPCSCHCPLSLVHCAPSPASPDELLLIGSVGKDSACNAGDLGLIPGSGRSLGEESVHPLQYSCLENSMDRGAWRAVCNPWGCKVRHDWLTNTFSPPLPFFFHVMFILVYISHFINLLNLIWCFPLSSPIR